MYKRNSQGWLKHLDFILLDILCLHIAFVTACVIRNRVVNPYLNLDYRNIAIVLTLIDVIVLISFNTLKNVLKRGYYKEFSITFQHVCLVEMGLLFYLFTTHVSGIYSRAVFYIASVLYFIFTYSARIAYKRYLQQTVRSGLEGLRSLLIVTTESMAAEAIENIQKQNYRKFHIKGVVLADRDRCGETVCGVPVVSTISNVADYACKEWIDEVLINLDLQDSILDKLIQQFSEMGMVIHIVLAKPSKLLTKRQFVEKIGDYTTLTTSINYASPKQMFLKRSMDILGGLVGCVITVILAVILGPLIYMHSPGPIFFSQIRVGKNGKKFKMYKFRSMYLDAEERKKELEKENRVKDGMMFKLEYDPRIIGCRRKADGTIKKGIGNYIRDWSLDEFPQFFNILKGDMSLVGTRPPTVDEWEKYELHHRTRLAIKPGLTGMWQVSGRSNITDFEEVVKLDIQYIYEWSLDLDIKLLFKTAAVVLRKDGSM